MGEKRVVGGGGPSFGTEGEVNYRRWGGRKSPAMTIWGGLMHTA